MFIRKIIQFDPKIFGRSYIEKSSFFNDYVKENISFIEQSSGKKNVKLTEGLKEQLLNDYCFQLDSLLSENVLNLPELFLEQNPSEITELNQDFSSKIKDYAEKFPEREFSMIISKDNIIFPDTEKTIDVNFLSKPGRYLLHCIIQYIQICFSDQEEAKAELVNMLNDQENDSALFFSDVSKRIIKLIEEAGSVLDIEGLVAKNCTTYTHAFVKQKKEEDVLAHFHIDRKGARSSEVDRELKLSFVYREDDKFILKKLQGESKINLKIAEKGYSYINGDAEQQYRSLKNILEENLKKHELYKNMHDYLNNNFSGYHCIAFLLEEESIEVKYNHRLQFILRKDYDVKYIALDLDHDGYDFIHINVHDVVVKNGRLKIDEETKELGADGKELNHRWMTIKPTNFFNNVVKELEEQIIKNRPLETASSCYIDSLSRDISEGLVAMSNYELMLEILDNYYKEYKKNYERIIDIKNITFDNIKEIDDQKNYYLSFLSGFIFKLKHDYIFQNSKLEKITLGNLDINRLEKILKTYISLEEIKQDIKYIVDKIIPIPNNQKTILQDKLLAKYNNSDFNGDWNEVKSVIDERKKTFKEDIIKDLKDLSQEKSSAGQ